MVSMCAILLFLLYIGERDTETGQSVGICAQGEGASVFCQYFADEYQTDTLAVRFCGEERAEKSGFNFPADTLTCICYLERYG